MIIRPFEDKDTEPVKTLFTVVNRLLAPKGRERQFEDYIEQSLTAEIDQITAYYDQRHGGFWVAELKGRLVGMFGLEKTGPAVFELRRMYVDPGFRRKGIAVRLLQHAEEKCREFGGAILELSTSELQKPALAFYEQAGYRLVREEQAQRASSKTIGGGIKRFHFEKTLN